LTTQATETRVLDNYVSGRWTPAIDAGEMLDVADPATGQVLARVPMCGAADVDAAVVAARAALPEWRAVATIARARMLFDLRERLVARSEELATSGRHRRASACRPSAGRRTTWWSCPTP
jgi:malonate-semialdehyde dehydrogenase (acetylating)/methylmalonate-semialdehyde dehydrogenase